ncbi:hypothetical protein RZS28_14530 [Methylocapsa polymorpha]|uniref:Uncharacterized protein n=1 Tax=Methylocapsa polymorpha TaxID=3080828 RepID=A0ABZ0HRN3_9HYPH|nr:hypothetical protein RZS28_14530 [Methylocapsa sp. RX1]
MENFLIKVMRAAISFGMITFPVVGFIFGYYKIGGYGYGYGINNLDLLGLIIYTIGGAIGGFIAATIAFGPIAILLKIEQNTRPPAAAHDADLDFVPAGRTEPNFSIHPSEQGR